MSDKTGVDWAGSMWNVLAGCSKRSAECDDCYAIRDVWRLSHNPHESISSTYEGLVSKQRNDLLNWTGDVRFIEKKLNEPLNWKQPRPIFVTGMSDIGHARVRIDWLEQIVRVMLAADHHTYLCLTKRVDRLTSTLQSVWGRIFDDYYFETVKMPPHIWIGATAGCQKSVNERIPQLYQLKKLTGVKTWISGEPLIERVHFNLYRYPVDWLVLGGESGRKNQGEKPWQTPARICNVEWIQYGIEQARDTGAMVYVKQFGTNAIGHPDLAQLKGKKNKPELWTPELREQFNLRETPALQAKK